LDFIEARHFQLRHKCAICGNEPQLYPTKEGGYDVRCQNRNHKGFTKLKSYTQIWREGQAVPIEIANKIQQKEEKRMEEELGKEKGTELAKYFGVATLTKKQLSEILMSLWPKAPPLEVAKATMLCLSYGLNPLMKHLALIPFKNTTTGEITWSTIMSLQATELIIGRKHRWSYLDGPRIMKPEEQEETFGGTYKDTLVVKVLIKDSDGNQAPGCGLWGKDEKLKGAEKGNTKFNMASIRAIRQALTRLFPQEMPTGIDIADERFIEGEWGEKGGEKAAKGQPPSTASPAKRPLKDTSPIKGEDFPKPEKVRNWDQTINYAKHFFDLEEEDCLKMIGKTDKSQVANASEAWATIVRLKIEKPEE